MSLYFIDKTLHKLSARDLISANLQRLIVLPQKRNRALLKGKCQLVAGLTDASEPKDKAVKRDVNGSLKDSRTQQLTLRVKDGERDCARALNRSLKLAGRNRLLNAETVGGK